MSSKIEAFLHCGKCAEFDRTQRLEVGLTDRYTLRVWCGECDSLVKDFTLAEPIQPRCDVCGETVGPQHTH